MATGQTSTFKTCRQCGASKELTEFPFIKNKKRHSARCKVCVQARQAAWLRESRRVKGISRAVLPLDANDQVLARRAELLGKIANNTERDPKTGCLEWRTARKRGGYGLMMVQLNNGSWFQFGVHRIVARIFHGLDLSDPDTLACHRCDNRSCCEEGHIFVGTHADNQRDAASKGRLRHKLSVEMVARIRASAVSRELAEEFGVARSTIQHVRRRASWSHVA